MIFCKSLNFLHETDETLNNHVSFINTVFNVKLQRINDCLDMKWYTADGNAEILYLVGHTGNAKKVIRFLHNLCVMGIGTRIRDVYLTTCSSKPDNNPSSVQPLCTSSIILLSEASEEEKRVAGVVENTFATLDGELEMAKGDVFNVHLCKQDTVEDAQVKMAHFLPMDECGFGFSNTKSELILYNHKGSLSEKLSAAFEDV